MRNRWEDKGEDLDNPVTLTEAKLRSLERGAKLGMFGLILALIATGVAGWAMFRTPKEAPVPETETISAPAPAVTPDTAAVQPASTPPGAPTAGAAPAPEPTQVAVTASTEKHTVKAMNASARPKRVGRQTHGSAKYTPGPAPKMESFDTGPAKPSATTPAPSPVPVPVSPAPKSAADTTGH